MRFTVRIEYEDETVTENVVESMLDVQGILNANLPLLHAVSATIVKHDWTYGD